jgi:hypothetical protein
MINVSQQASPKNLQQNSKNVGVEQNLFSVWGKEVLPRLVGLKTYNFLKKKEVTPQDSMSPFINAISLSPSNNQTNK